MKKLIVFITILLFPAYLFSFPIGKELAKKSAQEFLERNLSLRGSHDLEESKMFMSYAGLYVFNIDHGENGFVCVSADTRLPKILAYSYERISGESSYPPAMIYWLNEYERQIKLLDEGKMQFAQEENIEDEVAPLLGDKILWDQDTPFNDNFVPLGEGFRKSPVGCVATALGQILRYYKWPDQGVGSYSYTDDNGITHRTDFSKPFDWEHMPGVIGEDCSDREKQAIAYFMENLAYALNMQFYLGVSATSNDYVVMALRNHFKFKRMLHLTSRMYYKTTDWENIIRNELRNKRPVYYTGIEGKSGHAFVCDGFDRHGYFHFNWGWSGVGNGYYKLLNLVPTGLGIGSGMGSYNGDQDILVNLIPDKDNNPGKDSERDVSGSVYGEKRKRDGAIVLTAYYFTSSDPTLQGKIRLSVYDKDSNKLVKTIFESSCKINYLTPSSFSRPISKGSLSDGRYYAALEWSTSDGNDSYKEIRKYEGAPSRVFILVKDGELQMDETVYTPISLSYVKNSVQIKKLLSLDSCVLSLKLLNNGDDEYVGPVEIQFCDENGKPQMMDSRKLNPFWVSIPAKQDVTVVFDYSRLPVSAGDYQLYLKYWFYGDGAYIPSRQSRVKILDQVKIRKEEPYSLPTCFFTPKAKGVVTYYIKDEEDNKQEYPQYSIVNKGRESFDGDIAVVLSDRDGAYMGMSKKVPIMIAPGQTVSYTPEFQKQLKVGFYNVHAVLYYKDTYDECVDDTYGDVMTTLEVKYPTDITSIEPLVDIKLVGRNLNVNCDDSHPFRTLVLYNICGEKVFMSNRSSVVLPLSLNGSYLLVVKFANGLSFNKKININ